MDKVPVVYVTGGGRTEPFSVRTAAALLPEVVKFFGLGTVRSPRGLILTREHGNLTLGATYSWSPSPAAPPGPTGTAAAQGPAAPPSPPGTAAAQGTCLLVDVAPELKLKCEGPDGAGQVWWIKHKDGSPDNLYLDTAGVIEDIKYWAEYRCRYADHKMSGALSTLMVSGVIKTGKSHTLDKVVPAVLAETLKKQRQGHRLEGMVVLRLNGLNLQRKKGGAGLLCGILKVVLAWAADTNVLVDNGAWKAAQRALADYRSTPNDTDMCERAGTAVVRLFAGFQVPVLVLLDELQALLQPTDVRGNLDLEGAGYIRDVVLRQILVDSPPNVLWAVTGSSMAVAWMALAAMPPNGVVPQFQVTPVQLPSAFPASLMNQVVGFRLEQLELQQKLQQQGAKLLVEWSGDSPALFTVLLEAWIAAARRAHMDMGEFISDFMQTKMVEEASHEWALGLAHMTDEERRAILDLACFIIGAQIDINRNRGLWNFLRPYMLQTKHGRYYLKDANQRQLLRIVIDRDGKLRTSWWGLGPGLTYVWLDWGWHLLRLGEVAGYLHGQRRPLQSVSDQMDGVEQLEDMLRGLANKVEQQLPAGDSVAAQWEALDTFTKVLHSRENTASRRWYEEKDGKKTLKSHVNFLAFFLRLSRNMLAHQKPWDGTEPVNLEVLMALPTMVNMRVTELSEVVRVGMSALAIATVQTAGIDAAAAADGDGEETGGGRGGDKIHGCSSGDGGDDSDGGGDGGDGSGGGDEDRNIAPRALHTRGARVGIGIVSCTSLSRTTTLSSGRRAALSLVAEGASLGRQGRGRVVQPVLTCIPSMRLAVMKAPFLFR